MFMYVYNSIVFQFGCVTASCVSVKEDNIFSRVSSKIILLNDA